MVPILERRGRHINQYERGALKIFKTGEGLLLTDYDCDRDIYHITWLSSI